MSEREPKNTPSASSSIDRLREEIRKASADALPGLVYRALELSDPLLRRRFLREIFSRMDSSPRRNRGERIRSVGLRST